MILRKIAASALVTSVLVPSLALAQSATSTDVSAQVQALLAQLQALQQQLRDLQAQQQTLRQEQHETFVELVRTLRQGQTGDDVSAIQALLAADPEVYPEGLITGYYGRLTSAAVRRFQKKHGLEQVGNVGPLTLGLLKKMNKDTPIALAAASSTPGTDQQVCAKIPPGHFIAPGWLRKHGGVRPIVPECQMLPPGIQKKIDNNWSPDTGTTTPPAADTTAPVISSLTVTNIATTSATVSWTTDENANGTVYYSTSTPVDTGTASMMTDATLKLPHAFDLTSLASSTLYYVLVQSTDGSANTATSTISFTTL